MTTIEIRIVHTTDPEDVAARQAARARLHAFLDACDAARGDAARSDAFWAFYRLFDPGLTGLPDIATEGDSHDRT